MTVTSAAPNVFDAGLPTFDYSFPATPQDIFDDLRAAQSRAPIAIGPLGPEILPSITRAIVLQLAQDVGLVPNEQALTPKQAARMDELFIAVTTKDIVPVTEFDGLPVSGGKSGDYTKALLQRFHQFVEHQ